MKKVMIFGTFDILHPGHIDFIKQSKKYGDHLSICVARDENIKKIKGRLPLNNLSERIKALKVKLLADDVFAGDKTDFFKVIAEKRPALICLGYDQKALGLEKYIKDNKIKLEILRMKPFKENINKSSIIKKNHI
jgi:FAD synthetase